MPMLICAVEGAVETVAAGPRPDGAEDSVPRTVLRPDLVEALTQLRDAGWELLRVEDGEQFHRPDPRYFAEVLRHLPRHGPRLYVDDDPRNVSAARRAGLDAHLYSDAPTLWAACRAVLVAAP